MLTFKEVRDAISKAHNPDKVLALVRVCMAEVPADRRDSLPAAAKNALEPTVSLADAAVDLVRCELHFTGPHEEVELLHEIAQTFAVASAQISRIRNGRA